MISRNPGGSHQPDCLPASTKPRNACGGEAEVSLPYGEEFERRQTVFTMSGFRMRLPPAELDGSVTRMAVRA